MSSRLTAVHRSMMATLAVLAAAALTHPTAAAAQGIQWRGLVGTWKMDDAKP